MFVTPIFYLNHYRMQQLRLTGRIETDAKPLTDFREISVYPTEEDLTAAVELRPNCVDKGKRYI